MNRLCRWSVCAGVLLGGAVMASAQAPLWLGDWYPEVEVTLTVDDNVNRAARGEKSDIFMEPGVDLVRQDQVGEDLFSYVRLGMSGAFYLDYHKLGYARPQADAGVRGMIDGVPGGEWHAGMALAYEFHNQDIRSVSIAEPYVGIEAEAVQGLTLGALFSFESRMSAENPVYEGDQWTVSLYGDLAATEKVSLIGSVAFSSGDAVVHQPRSDLGEEIRGERLPLSTFGSRYDAVRATDADTLRLEAGVRYYLSRYAQFEGRLALEDIDAVGESHSSLQMIFGFSYLL
jgi:hypothetical protein